MLRGQRFSWVPWVLALACFHFVLAEAHATTLRHRSLRELVRLSDATVLGRAIGRTSAWEGTRIMTRVEVEIDEIWAQRQQLPRKIQVVVPGGVVGDIGQRVEGAAALPADGRLVLHLYRFAEHFVPTGMAQGVWWVESVDGPDGSVRRGPTDKLVMGLSAASMAANPTTLAALRSQVMEFASEP